MTGRSGVHAGLAILAGALGALAVAAGEPYPGDASPRRNELTGDVGVLEVARRLRDRSASIRLVDIRTDSQFAAYHIPGAEHVQAESLPRLESRREEPVVIYADDDRRARRASLLLRERGVERARALPGGVVAWIDSIVEPRLAPLPEPATVEQRAARREHLELSRYFGGTPVVSPAPAPAAPDSIAPLPSPRRSETDAVARIRRRGC